MRCVIDIEGDGLLDDITKLWCAVSYDIDTQQYSTFDFVQGNKYEDFTAYLDEVDVFIGHHIIGYDLPAIKKILGYGFRGDCVDTVVLSRTLNPDRKLPEGCPTHIPDSEGKKKLVGPHSLEAYGYLLGKKKPRIERWDVYTPKMVHRCQEDVGINYLTLNYLLQEAGTNELVSVPVWPKLIM